MFPYKDDNPTILTPYVTFGIIALNVSVWLFVQHLGAGAALSRSICTLGLIPGELLHRVPPGYALPMGRGVSCLLDGGANTWLTPLTSMFLHGGWFHLIGNMWFLWVFGNNVEDSMGHARFALFYVVTGLAAAATQVLVTPSSPIPMVGASGAISGVMGAYILLYPRVRVHMVVFLGFFVTTIAVPAYLMLGYWLLLQVLGGIPALANESGGVAFWAHAGGFAAGMLLISLFQNPELVARRRLLAPT